ncbi:MAG: hypothetical protein IKW38_03765 [Kiritimatiellae bacterium]|nr:hypothetical protein [Kiritimatiellia bacterium]
MSKFFKSLLLLLSAGLFVVTGWAVTLINPNPTASFTDFSTIPAGTTTEAKTLTNNGVTLTLPVGITKNDDGSIYLNNKSGAKVTLSAETQTIAVVLDLVEAPVAPTNPGNTSYTLLVNFDSGTDIAAAYTGSGIRGAWGGSLNGRTAEKAWTAEATKVLAATSSTGGTTIRVKDNTDANKWNEGGLKARGNRYQVIDIGPTLTLKGIYVYDTYQDDIPSFTEVSAYERTIEGGANWAATDAWATGVTNPEAGTSAMLNVTGDATLMMNEASNALNYIEIKGSGSLTITGSNTLTAASTIVKANTIVETSASLGAVTLENDATLTVKSLNAFTSIAGEGTLALDLGDEADVEYTGNFPTTVKLSLLSGSLTYKHNSAHRAIKALNIAEEATFADVADYKYNLTINDKFSGAGTYLVKVPTNSSQTDGWRYLFVNGDAAEFTGNVKLQIQHNANQNQNGGAPYRTGVRLTGTAFGGTVTAEATGDGVTDADLAYAHLDIDESLTMTKAQSFAGKIDVASGKTLTAANGVTLTNAGKLEGTGTIAAPLNYSSTAETTFGGVISGEGTLTVSKGVLTLTGANTYDGATTVAFGAKLVANTTGAATWDYNDHDANIVVNGEVELTSTNECYRGFEGAGKITVKGSVILGNTGDSGYLSGLCAFTGTLVVEANNTLTLKTWGQQHKTTLAALEAYGNIEMSRNGGTPSTVDIETAQLKGVGIINVSSLKLTDNATIDVTAGAVTATTTATLPNAFTVKISAEQDAIGVVTVMTSPNVVITDKIATVLIGKDEAEYTLHADAATVWVEKAGVELLETVEVTFTEGGTLVLSDALDGKALAPSATLEINFGNKGENEPNPGIFEFDCDAAFAQITITGTNGGTITKTGTVTVTASSTTIDADTTVNAGAANLGTVTINAEKTLTVKEDWTNVATNVPTTATNLGKIRFEGGSAETPIVFSMGDAANGNPGALVMAPGAYVKLMSSHVGSASGNKVYNITGETGGAKPNVYLYGSKGWGMSENSVVRDVKLIVPSANNNDFWLRPGATDATVDLELQGRKLTGDSGNGAIVLGDFVTNAEVVANGKSLSVQTGRISGTAGFDSAIAVDNSGAGSFTVARTYGAALTINSNGSVTVAEGGSLTGTVSVTGTLTYATNATPTNTITNNGTITADTATVDLTGATISGNGTYGVTNNGTLILKAGTENGASVTSGTLKLLLSEEDLVKGYTANVADGTKVTFVVAGDTDGDGDGYDTVTEGVDGNEYAAPMNVWTPSEDATWANIANWSNEALPGETDNVEIQITEDTELELTSDVTVAALRVVGSGTLTITGGKLTATFIDAETAINAGDTTLALVPMTISENVSVTYNTTVDAAMPAVTGLGDFVKTGAAKLTLDNATACEATIDVTGGTLELSGNPGSAWTYAYSGVYRFIARESTTIDIANAFIDMPSTESEITLKGGALLNIKNGNTWENRRSIGAKILIEESSAGKPAIIKGSTNGDYSKLTGGITGSGVLEIQGNGNTFAITGAIKDQENAQLAVKINTANGVTFSGANTYTGGTEVAANALLMVNTFGNLGNSGTINVQGKLQFSNSSNSGTNNQDANAWARLQGSGTIQFENASGNNWYAIRSIATTLDVVNNNRDPNTQDTDDHGGLVVTHDATIGTLSGEGWFRSDLNNSNRTLTIVQSKASEFSGYFKSYANSGGRKLNVLVQSNDATPKTLTLSGNSIHGANDADVNTLTIDTTGSVCLTGSWQGNLTNNGIISGRGTITGTLTFGNAAMLDVSTGEILTANTLADLPAELTVKVANALEVGGALDIMTTMATPNTASTTVTVKVGKEAVKGIYSLVATGTTLQLVRGEDSLMGSVYLADSNAALTEKVDSGKMGDGDQWGVQIDMDAANPYGPGWQATQALKTFSVVRAKNDVSQSWENITVSIVDIEDTTTVLATSEVGVEETDYILTYSGGGTEGRKLLTFTFATAVNLDASKTYQFRFNEARKIRMIHIQSISDGAKNTSAINVLNSNFVVEKATEYTPIVELGVEIPALVINASAVPVDVAEVPTTLALDTASFMGGYGTTYTVLNYTGEGDANWQGMTYYGLPEGAEVFTTDKTWGFTMKMIRVLPIGDSITAGLVTYHNSSANWHVAGGYRLPLYQYMTQAYGEGKVKYLGTSTYPTSVTGDSSQNSYEDRDIDSVTLTEAGQLNHEGHSGATLDGNNCQMYDRFKNQKVLDIIAEQGAPDVITLHLGTNDFGMGSDTVDTAKADMKKLLFLLNGSGTGEAGDTPLYPNATIFVAKIIPRSGDITTNKLKPFNEWLTTYVEELNSDKLVLVDLNMACNYGLLRHDGLHPSTEGYSRMAQNWFVNIEAALPPMGADASIASVDARVANTLKVTTNKAINAALTQTWTLDKDATVTAAKIADDKRTVILTVEGVVANTEYTLTATNLFAADDSVTKTFSTTADIHTPKTDVVESDRAGAVNTAGVLKAAEWTTFAGFATGYTSPIGYMPESGRPWQLDVRGTNVPTVTDGVLSLNGAPLTVNFKDGHIGTTKSVRTTVMEVSNLSAGDVLFTETGNGNELNKITVEDADTLTWNSGSVETIELAGYGINLTDDIPEVITETFAAIGGGYNCKLTVNGIEVATSNWVSSGEWVNGNWTIGANSTATAGSTTMKLYRLSFYEGAATVVVPNFAIINVGEEAGQYTSWKAAQTALGFEDAMTAVTINFTAADQTFTFDNAEAVTIDAVTVQGTAGGTIAKADGAGTVTATNLAINTSVKMNDDAMALTGDVAIAADCVLTYNVGDGMTVNATHSGAGSIAVTSAGVYGSTGLTVTKTCGVNVSVSDYAVYVADVEPGNTNSESMTKAFANNTTVTVAEQGVLSLKQGISFNTINSAGTVRVDGTYTLGFGQGENEGSLTTAHLIVNTNNTLKVKAFRAIDMVATGTICVYGSIVKDENGSATPNLKVTAASTLSIWGTDGAISLPVIFEDGATIYKAAIRYAPVDDSITLGAAVTLPAQLAITLPNDGMPTEETPAVLLKTTAFVGNEGVHTATLNVNGRITDEYVLYKTAEAVELRYAPWTIVTSATASGDVNTWSEVLADMEAKRQRFDTTANPSLVIDFGSGNEPGTFTFDMGEGDPLDGNAVFTLGTVTIQGSAGGTVAKTGSANISANATKVNTNVEIAQNTMELGTTTLAAGCTLTVNDAAALGTDAGRLTATATSTVRVVGVNNNSVNLGNWVSNASNLTLNNVKAYLYDCTIGTLTLEGDFQMNNGTTNKKKTQCVTVNTLAGTGTFIGHQSSEVCIAVNVKSWTNFTGSIDLSNEKSKNTIFFFGTAPQRFIDAASNAYDADDAQEYFANDYGTVYVTVGNTVATAATSTWKLQKLVVETNAAFQINGWATIATSCTGAVTVENGGVLDLRTLTDAQLEVINVTVKAGGRLLVNTGATVPAIIVFETGSILGVATKHVEDVGNATLTVNVDGTAATVPTIKGYHMDGVTELDNWKKNDQTSSEGEFKFNFDPVFDGELCWWAYEFDNEVNTSPESNLGPISTGRDKGRMNFDGRGDSNRVCQDNEYVDHGDGTKAIRVASSPWRNVDGGYPTAFTAAMYGTLTENRNRIIMGFGSSYNQKYTIALVTGASTDEVRLVLQKGWNENNTDYPEDAVITLATTTVPNAVTENHLFAFSYEQFDSDADKTLDSTRIIFYVDGEKYQPFTAKAIIPLGNGFQMGSIHGGWHNSLTRMNGDDVNCTMEYLRIYDQILPESVWTAMSNEYSYMSKNGRATRTIVEGQDTTWNEGTEWTQIRAVKDGNGGYVLDAEGHVTFDNGTDVEKPDHGENVGTQVVLNVDGANTLFLNEFYSSPIQEGEVSKLYYERLEINPVEGGDEDSLTLWAGRLNPEIEEEDSLKNSQSAVITVQGYTKINTNVTMAHNVAFLSGPVAVAEGKTLTFDFSGFDVMKVPSMPTEYRLTGFLDEVTRDRVKHNFRDDDLTKNARSVDLGYKTDVNQYTFKVDRHPVTAYFRDQDDVDLGADGVNASQTPINFNDLYYKWQGLAIGKQMDWDVDTVDADGNHVDEHVLANFVSVDAETKQPKIVTVTLDSVSDEAINLTLPESALKKQVTHGDDNEGNPIWEEVNMLGAEQLIVGDKVTVDYNGNPLTLAPALNAASAETSGVIRAQGFTVDTWRANLSVTGGALAGVGKISGKVTFEAGASLDASATTVGSCLSAKDADLTNLKAITVNVDAAAGKTLKVLDLPAGHTAKSLEGCTVTAVNGEGETVATWTESGATNPTLVVVRADGLYVTGRPVVKAGETEVTNNDLTLPLARRAAELSATSVSLTGVVNMAGKEVDASVADAAEVFTNVAFDMTETPVNGVVTAKLKYDFGVSQINVVTIDSIQYVVAELIVSNHTDLGQNTAAYAADTTIDVTVKVGNQSVVADKDIVEAADMTGAEVAPAAELPASTRYVRFPMPSGNGTFEIKARAAKSAQ